MSHISLLRNIFMYVLEEEEWMSVKGKIEYKGKEEDDIIVIFPGLAW